MIKPARFNALLRSNHVNTQTKQLCNMEITEKDKELADEYIAQAKLLSPKGHMITLLEADSMSSSGDFTGAYQLCDDTILQSDPNDGSPFVMKANVTMSEVSQSN